MMKGPIEYIDKTQEVSETGVGMAMVSVFAVVDKIKKQAAKVAPLIKRYAEEKFNELAELKEGGLDLISIVSFTRGLTAALIDCSRDIIREEGFIGFLKAIPREVQGVRDLANRGWDGNPVEKS